MVAKTPRASLSSATKHKSSAHTSSSGSSPASKHSKASSTSLVQASAKTSLKKGKTAGKKSNKFRDSEKRELLDGQTNQLFNQKDSKAGGEGGADPFSYNMPSQADQRKTRAEVDAAVLALEVLMKS